MKKAIDKQKSTNLSINSSYIVKSINSINTKLKKRKERSVIGTNNLEIETSNELENLVYYKPLPNMKEIERYWVDKPYSFVCILYNNNERTINYHIVEPKLNKFEKKLLQEFSNIMDDRLLLSYMKTENELNISNKYQLLKENTRQILNKYFETNNATFEKTYYYLKRDFIEFGPINSIMQDPNIEDIWCNGVNIALFLYHKAYGNMKTNILFSTEEELDYFVTLIAQQSSKHLSRSTPILDTIMRDGSRINITYGRDVSPHGSSFSIRKQKKVPLTPLDLIAWGTFSSQMMAYFWLCMENGKNILFCGGTASGKTSSLNAICLFIPINTRIVTLEDTREINLPHKNWISVITREGLSINKAGSIDLEDLLRSSLRQRPEYLLVGEVRGRESHILFQAMNAGHATCSTFHAGKPQEVINRFTNPPINVPNAMFSALNIICLQTNVYLEGREKRKASHVTEIIDVVDGIQLQDSFLWDSSTDTFEFKNSYVLSKIGEKMGWDDLQVENEVNRRSKFLKLLVKKGVRDYQYFMHAINLYNQNPEKVIEKLDEINSYKAENI